MESTQKAPLPTNGILDVMYWVERTPLLGTTYDLLTASIDADEGASAAESGACRQVVYCALRALPSGQENGQEALLAELHQTLRCAGNIQLTPHYPSNHETVKQVLEYLAGHRREFDLPLKLYGTIFQQKVWRALLNIPYGATQCYADIAAAVENPRGARAVGMANNRNPISLIVPCHRVIGKNGRLVGYGGGLDLKANLLALEQAH